MLAAVRRRLTFLATTLLVAQSACTPAASSPAAEPRGRYCTTPVAVSADTTFDFHGRQQQLGPRSLSRGGPRYPQTLRAQNVEGRVIASFVIDTTGVVLVGTAAITEESNPGFGSAVCMWLQRDARFEPLVVGDHRYLVRMTNFPVDFGLNR
jgi:hypothetical protein